MKGLLSSRRTLVSLGLGSAMVAASLTGCQRSSSPRGESAPLTTTESGMPAKWELAYLEGDVGITPQAARLWQSGPLQLRLQKLLGAAYGPFVEDMTVASKIDEEDQVVYVVGRGERDGAVEQAIFMADVRNDVIEVKIVSKGTVQDFAEAGPPIHTPPALTSMMSGREEPQHLELSPDLFQKTANQD